ncbi:hypothetical protein SAMN02982931_03703 [Bauldia litoralis]|uniref:Sensory transduction regulator n=2 Tax=Bauldia litoralis TaxID=665467 RepID=A0A1G6DTD1_9HYPH|nr:hypothetical protein SAMN02982931_03703 [Bauldia litoralis]
MAPPVATQQFRAYILILNEDSNRTRDSDQFFCGSVYLCPLLRLSIRLSQAFMTFIEIEQERQSHPVDVIEHIAALNDWSFERAGDDEITVSVAGGWSDYHVSFSWMEDKEAIHLACAFDLKVPEARVVEVMRLLTMVNEQMWIGHFDLWTAEGVIMFRQALLLSGGAEPNSQQVERLLVTAIEACDRYFQAFQFVVWAGKDAAEALEGALFETAGEA